MCPPASPHEGASVGKYTNMFWCEQTLFMNRNDAFADVDVSFTHGNGSFAGGNVPFADGNASFADRDVSFTHGNAFFAGGDVPFMDGNAAARTFGRAHRRRPYHFSYGLHYKIVGE